MFLHRATPVLNANVRAFNLFAQSLKPHKYILSLGAALSWPEKVNTDRFRKTGKEGRVPRAQSGLQRVAGLGLWLGDTSEPHGHPGALSRVPPMPDGCRCSPARRLMDTLLPGLGKPLGFSPSHHGIHGWESPALSRWVDPPPPAKGTATSALGKRVRAGNRFFPH